MGFDQAARGLGRRVLTIVVRVLGAATSGRVPEAGPNASQAGATTHGSASVAHADGVGHTQPTRRTAVG
jgi:hypothetical protein